MPATCFATPNFVFAEPALTGDAFAADLKVGTTDARLKSRPTDSTATKVAPYRFKRTNVNGHQPERL